MKTTNILLGILLVLVSAMAVSDIRDARQRQSIQWDYDSFTASGHPFKELDIKGRDGWELVSAVSEGNGVRYIFRRQRGVSLNY